MGTLATPSVQAHELPFKPLTAGDQKASLSRYSVTPTIQALEAFPAWGPFLLLGTSGT